MDHVIGENLIAIGCRRILMEQFLGRSLIDCVPNTADARVNLLSRTKPLCASVTLKKPHPTPERYAFYTEMKKSSGDVLRGSGMTDYAAAAMQQMELYCAAHPGSPSAVRQPRLIIRGELWIALLGPSMEEGIVGIGPSVTAALRAFDAQYLAGLRPPVHSLAEIRAQRRTDSTARRPLRHSKAQAKLRAEFSYSWRS